MVNKILKTELVEWKNLKLFQPAELKKMTKTQFEKLKESFRKNGFRSPFYVWQEKNNLWCLDGHTRIPILKLLEESGEVIPAKLTANFIDCKNKKEAKKAVLIYNSHYATIQEDSLFDFISDLNFEDLKLEIDINGIDFIKFENGNETEIEVNAEESNYISFLVDEKQRKIILKRLSEINGENNTEKLITLCQI